MDSGADPASLNLTQSVATSRSQSYQWMSVIWYRLLVVSVTVALALLFRSRHDGGNKQTAAVNCRLIINGLAGTPQESVPRPIT